MVHPRHVIPAFKAREAEAQPQPAPDPEPAKPARKRKALVDQIKDGEL